MKSEEWVWSPYSLNVLLKIGPHQKRKNSNISQRANGRQGSEIKISKSNILFLGSGSNSKKIQAVRQTTVLASIQ